MSSKWFKNDEESRIWWLDNSDEKIGVFIFSFDKEKQFNLFADYPYKLSEKEKEIFDKDEPFWADFFREREEHE